MMAAIYNGVQPTPSLNKKIEIVVTNKELIDLMLEVSSIEGKKAVLDHACYDQPAPHFLLGDTGVEETLCKYSDLYNVLTTDQDMISYFDFNKKHKNGGLYLDRGFYIGDLDFEYKGNSFKYDVIGATAPNKYRYRKFSDEDNTRALKNRIDFFFSIAASNKIDIFIIGAFGCNVYNQDINEVVSIIKELLNGKYAKAFRKVYFNTNKPAQYEVAKQLLK